MREFLISANDAGQRLDKFVAKSVPHLPGTLVQKYIRLKRIKVNHKRAERDSRLNVGDIVEMYINDEFFVPISSDERYRTIKPKLSIIYEDEHILLLDKQPGISVHDDDGNTYIVVDAELKRRLEAKLIMKILEFKIA